MDFDNLNNLAEQAKEEEDWLFTFYPQSDELMRLGICVINTEFTFCFLPSTFLCHLE